MEVVVGETETHTARERGREGGSPGDEKAKFSVVGAHQRHQPNGSASAATQKVDHGQPRACPPRAGDLERIRTFFFLLLSFFLPLRALVLIYEPPKVWLGRGPKVTLGGDPGRDVVCRRPS